MIVLEWSEAMRWTRCAMLLAGMLLVAGCSGRLPAFNPLLSLNGETSARERDRYADGKAHLEEGRTARAIQAFHVALLEQPASIRVLNALAVAYEQIGRADLASDYFQRALTIDPASTQTLNNLGYTALRHGRTIEAEDYFQRALQLDQRNAIVMANLDLLDRTDGTAGPTLAVVTREPLSIRRAAWVERTSAFVQTVVTRPDPAVVAAAEDARIPPQLVSFVAR